MNVVTRQTLSRKPFVSPRDGAQQLIEMAGVERKAKAKFNNKTLDPKASREKYDPLRDQERRSSVKSGRSLRFQRLPRLR